VLRLVLASLHILALGIGLGAVWVRARALRGAIDRFSLQRAFAADTLWGVAALLWIGSGLWRLFASTEKPVVYYMQNHVFFMKMGFFVLILVLEIWPMLTLMRWRVQLGKGGSPESAATPAAARRVATISYVEAAIVVIMVFVAVALARGYGAG
jgi:putative membrane protein